MRAVGNWCLPPKSGGTPQRQGWSSRAPTGAAGGSGGSLVRAGMCPPPCLHYASPMLRAIFFGRMQGRIVERDVMENAAFRTVCSQTHVHGFHL